MDFLILDEAQRVKNYETKTASSIKRLQPKHTLIITGTPIENRLIDIFSVVSVLDPYFFGPLWEFSYQHCLFDAERTNKINGYYDLQTLNKKLSEILIRREKRNVLDQLPNVQQFDIPVAMAREQAEYHASCARAISMILRKKYLTAYDMQRLQLLLASMRMVCDSTFLVDGKTNVSPKMDELKHILFEQLDLRNNRRKIIIFSEWVKVHKLIGQVLRENKIGFVELNGKVPVKLRGDLIKKFENNPESQIFLSTEAGGAGLNLQIADTLINFELPWNPAKKNQRIGRIDRLGQKSSKLTIYNMITRNSIEEQIAAGLLIKQNLFEGVLDSESTTDYVDFSSKGRSQFIEQLEAFVKKAEQKPSAEDAELDEQTAEGVVQDEQAAEDAAQGGQAATVEQEDALTEDMALIDAGSAGIGEETGTETSGEAGGGTGEETGGDTGKESSGETDADTGADTGAETSRPQAGTPSPGSPDEGGARPHSESPAGERAAKAAEMEQVMTSGMQFLAGLYKMSTGKESGLENQQIRINMETGEVTMTFKLPM